MLAEVISEILDSPFVSPMAAVQWGKKGRRICVRARKDNVVMIPVRGNTPKINELSRRFRGALYMTPVNLSQAFLHIQLKKESRQYTAFIFDLTVY